MTFSLIAACDKERGIGKNGTLPWRLPGELAHFHHVTSEVTDASKRNAVIMGRKTWESIPEGRRPLPGRLNCIITRDAAYPFPEGALRFGSLEECLEYLDRHPVLDTGSRNLKEAIVLHGVRSLFSYLDSRLRGNDKLKIEHIFIIGGGELFRQAIAMPACSTIYLTEIDGVFGCDTFFPDIPQSGFKKVKRSDLQEENRIQYQFVEYRR